MNEFFIRAMSFAAPFFSDESSGYVKAADAREALEIFAGRYTHPAGLYSANAYESADAFHKGQDALAQWLCNHEREKQRITKGKGGYSYYGTGPGRFEIDGRLYVVDNPKAGAVTEGATP